MLDVLMESEAKKEKRLGGTTISVVIHAVLITLVLGISAKAGTGKPIEPDEPVIPIHLQPREPEPRSPSSPTPQVPERRDFPELPALPERFQDAIAPIEIADSLPNVELGDGGVSTEEISQNREKQGGAVPSAGSSDPASVFSPYQVEKQVLGRAGNPMPQYPDVLRESNVEGEVLAQFVVDTTGRADMRSFRVLESSHDLFAGSVRSVLPLMRFHAAEVGGRKVKQLVHQSFTFRINR